MKLLDELSLENISEQLSRGSLRYFIDARIESYSCKMVKVEKRQLRKLMNRLGCEKGTKSRLRLGSSRTIPSLVQLTGQPIASSSYQMSTCQKKESPTMNNTVRKSFTSTGSSSDEESSVSPSKSFTSSINCKDLFSLMSTLNISFGPEYDFLMADSEEFCLEPELRVIKYYISRLCSIYINKYESLAPMIWKVIEDEIHPQDCVIYSYRPDRHSDPYSTGCLASFNYFFFHNLLKRILFFSVRVLNKSPAGDDYDGEMQDIF